ncbi:MAG: imidazole glycerol phosphate synthase subunit HisH [Rhodomicrobium sp.]|jgi:glutamine amidotransferase
MTVAIVDYQSGNLHSAAKAFERAAREGGLSTDIVVTGDPEAVRRADRVVLPGVGAFGDCYRGLAGTPGMIEALREAVFRRGRPFFGICVGMQMLADRGLEHGVHKGLGWIAGEVDLIRPSDKSLKIPHMGWNTLSFLREHALIDGIPEGSHAYFVHSYQLRCADEGDVVARTDYGGPITALIARDNIAGSQFHPEKSQKLGLKLIANFLQWRP